MQCLTVCFLSNAAIACVEKPVQQLQDETLVFFEEAEVSLQRSDIPPGEPELSNQQ